MSLHTIVKLFFKKSGFTLIELSINCSFISNKIYLLSIYHHQLHFLASRKACQTHIKI